MRLRIVHLLIIGLYSALAVAVAFEAPYWIAPLEALPTAVVAASVFLAAALVHLWAVHAGHDTRTRAQVKWLAEAVERQGIEIAALQDTIKPLTEAGSGGAVAGDAGRPQNGEMMADIAMLRSLVARLSEQPDGAAILAGQEPPTPTHRPVSAAEHGGPTVATAPAPHTDEGDAPLAVVRAALQDDRVDLVLQPIVSLPQRKRRFYECFSRLRTQDGETILPDQYIAVAERAHLITAIDNMLLFRCIQIIRKIQRSNQNVDFFCNISPHTLADEDFFTDFVEFVEANRELAANLVFEFAQADFKRWSTVGALLLERLSQLGCRFSLDQVRDLNLDPNELARQRISFVKVDATRLLEGLQRDRQLIRSLRRLEIDVIAEKLESEARLLELLDYDIDYGQGYLFGEPRLARPAA